MARLRDHSTKGRRRFSFGLCLMKCWPPNTSAAYRPQNMNDLFLQGGQSKPGLYIRCMERMIENTRTDLFALVYLEWRPRKRKKTTPWQCCWTLSHLVLLHKDVTQRGWTNQQTWRDLNGATSQVNTCCSCSLAQRHVRLCVCLCVWE